ncbi:GNAT family N-acetyltransferase [Microbacterium sp. GXF0217]
MPIDVVPHGSLTSDEIAGLRHLFDAEYLDEHGEWDPAQPYGYAPHDVHVIARWDGRIVGHVGWERRTIGIGDVDATVAGVGGMLVSAQVRGLALGIRMLAIAARSMQDAGGIAYGYLGCREEVASFYRSCGWQRIVVAERSIARDGSPVVDEPGQPVLVLPIEHDMASWPAGAVDLRGRAW